MPTATHYTTKDITRFNSHIKIMPSGCHEWQGCVDKDGYGFISMGKKKNKRPHRVAWEIANGTIPDGMQANHTCDNPRCCNPAHIWIGSQKENLEDADRKGRSRRRGEVSGLAKLTASDVRDIKFAISLGARNHQLAEVYGVHHSNISHIRRGDTWMSAT